MANNCAKTKAFSLILLVLGTLFSAQPGAAQERWFQIEVSIFSNESYADRNEESWHADRLELSYPQRIRDLDSLLDNLMLPEFRLTEVEPIEPLAPAEADILTLQQPAAEDGAENEAEQIPVEPVGPWPSKPGTPWRFPDLARDPFLQLGPADSEFLQTNRALERDPGYRLLFHGLWRQPMPDIGRQTYLFISGGSQFDSNQELEGSLGFYFNADRTRIVIDANLWLSEFSISPDPEQDWQLPERPEPFRLEGAGLEMAGLEMPGEEAIEAEASQPEFYPVRIYHLQQQREMRSNEFHYLDHPALGLVVTVTPYEVPPYPEADEVLPDL